MVVTDAPEEEGCDDFMTTTPFVRELRGGSGGVPFFLLLLLLAASFSSFFGDALAGDIDLEALGRHWSLLQLFFFFFLDLDRDGFLFGDDGAVFGPTSLPPSLAETAAATSLSSSSSSSSSLMPSLPCVSCSIQSESSVCMSSSKYSSRYRHRGGPPPPIPPPMPKSSESREGGVRRRVVCLSMRTPGGDGGRVDDECGVVIISYCLWTILYH
mmetsp:Transcript_19506/g.46807  ORF Transcript_19506/g.46807 Transcript_19506/m.46807 type:complete len:213 (+) Transcript_19506:2316-2954(+)